MKKEDIRDELSNHGTLKIKWFAVFYHFLVRFVAHKGIGEHLTVVYGQGVVLTGFHQLADAFAKALLCFAGQAEDHFGVCGDPALIITVDQLRKFFKRKVLPVYVFQRCGTQRLKRQRNSLVHPVVEQQF